MKKVRILTSITIICMLTLSLSACAMETAPQSAPAPTTAPTGPFLTEAGFDHLRINEPLPASVPLMQPEEYGCAYARAETRRGPLFLMTIDGKIARVEVEAPGVTLENGLGIGSTGAEVVKVYSDRAVAEPNKYDDQGTDYQVKLSDTTGLIFNVSEDRVHAFRVGRFPELEWVEGCS